MVDYYIGIVKEAAKFAWERKYLWIFGFLVGSSSYSFNSNFIDLGKDNKNIELQNNFVNLFSNPVTWLVLTVAFVLILLIALVFWYLSRVAKYALIKSAIYNTYGENDKLKLSYLWTEGNKNVGKLLVYDAVWFLLGLVIGMLFAILIFVCMVFPPFICLAFPVGFFLIVLVILASTVKELGLKVMVMKNYGFSESIEAGYKILTGNFIELLKAFVVMIIPGCAFAIVSAVFLTIPFALVIVSSVLVSSTVNNLNPVYIFMLVLSLIIAALVTAIVRSPYNVFEEYYWTKVMMKFVDMNKENSTDAEIVK